MLPGVYRYISRKEHKIVIQHDLQIRRALQIKKNMLTYNNIRPIYMYDRNIFKYFSKFQIVYDTFFKYVHLKNSRCFDVLLNAFDTWSC